MTLKYCIAFLCTFIILSSCDFNKAEQKEKSNNHLTADLKKMVGVYVSDGYNTREEGNDWMAVTIVLLNDQEANINIRSRTDIKKPTCTFIGSATIINDHTLRSVFEGKAILFSRKGKQLSIATEKEEDKMVLHYFCSGGASLAGDYTKLDSPLDEGQLITDGFLKTLSLQNIDFKILATSISSQNMVTIEPSGLAENNNKVVVPIKGFVTDAVIQDLNSDGWPELLLYIDLGKRKKTGTVLAYSVNDGKSISRVFYPNTFDNLELAEGYMGADAFSIEGNYLVQTFPIHNESGKITDKKRKVQYKLVDGETSRVFEVHKVTDF